MDKVSALHPLHHGFEPLKGDNHDSSYDTSTVWLVPGSRLESDLNKL